MSNFINNCKIISEVPATNFAAKSRINREGTITFSFKEKNIFQIYYTAKGDICVAFTTTKCKKDICNYRFASQEKAENYIVRQMEAIERAEKYKQEAKEQRNAAKKQFSEKVAVDDIFYTSWGYDQTNVDFYQVVEVKGMKLKIRKIAGNYDQQGFNSGRVGADFGNFISDEITVMISGNGFSVNGHGASKTNVLATHYYSCGY